MRDATRFSALVSILVAVCLMPVAATTSKPAAPLEEDCIYLPCPGDGCYVEICRGG